MQLDHQVTPNMPCNHDRKTVYDFESTDSDTMIFKFKCRDCGFRFSEEVLGSLTRSKGFNPEEAR